MPNVAWIVDTDEHKKLKRENLAQEPTMSTHIVVKEESLDFTAITLLTQGAFSVMFTHSTPWNNTVTEIMMKKDAPEAEWLCQNPDIEPVSMGDFLVFIHPDKLSYEQVCQLVDNPGID